MEATHRTSDIVTALGIDRGRFREWIDGGFIEPTVPSPGQGAAALFTVDDAKAIKLFDILVSDGLDRAAAADVLRWLSERECVEFLGIARSKEQPGPEIFAIGPDTNSLSLRNIPFASDCAEIPMEGWDSLRLINLSKIFADVVTALANL